ncbi:outer membrane lipoprotein LolB [Moraxellaceae bacterium AER2_44_116]|jgi:outer membrane lipoprotein LolB|nr:outer membrane lipoprotein LolB [Moraxellaceae bacterium AER2_44_116]
MGEISVRIICTAATLMMLSGCASQSTVLALKTPYKIPTPVAAAIPTEIEIQSDVDTAVFPVVAAPSVWTATGKFSVKMLDADGQKKGGSAYFVWQQNADNYRITLTGPLGQGRTILLGTENGVILENAQVGHLESDSPESLFEQAFGWTAPVSYLKSWLEGKSATTNADHIYSENGNLQSVLEGAWQADFKNYRHVNTDLLPQKLVITGPNLSMTVLVSEWNKSL